MNKLKQTIKSILKYLHFDVTLNMKYDRQTALVIKRVLKSASNTIDVGCHKGEMLQQFLMASPNGMHFGFEPIPVFFHALKEKFESDKCKILPFALAENSGKSEFNYVKNAPAYSGIKQRKYAIENPEIQKIEVELRRLDDIIDENQKIDLIKIDVEGAELGVLLGASNTIVKNKPIVIFECGLGASEFYNTKPEEVYKLISNTFGLKVSTMKKWLKGENDLNEAEFCRKYSMQEDYYFIAYP